MFVSINKIYWSLIWKCHFYIQITGSTSSESDGGSTKEDEEASKSDGNKNNDKKKCLQKALCQYIEYNAINDPAVQVKNNILD